MFALFKCGPSDMQRTSRPPAYVYSDCVMITIIADRSVFHYRNKAFPTLGSKQFSVNFPLFASIGCAVLNTRCILIAHSSTCQQRGLRTLALLDNASCRLDTLISWIGTVLAIALHKAIFGLSYDAGRWTHRSKQDADNAVIEPCLSHIPIVPPFAQSESRVQGINSVMTCASPQDMKGHCR